MNKIIRVLFASLLFVFPAKVRAQYTYITNADTSSVTVTAFSGGGNVVMPSRFNGLPITAIGSAAFFSNSNLTGISIGTNVGLIQFQAFARCYNLTNVTLPSSVTNISSNAFRFAALTNVALPTNLGTLDSLSFANTALTNVYIPASVTNIGAVPFYQSTALTAITVDPSNTVYASSNGVLLAVNSQTLLEFPGGMSGSYVIPDSVLTIATNAFTDSSNLATVTISDSVTNIEANAFFQCSNLLSITIGSDVTTIGILAFGSCTKLTNVCFQGNESTNFAVDAFNADPLSHIFYITGTTGWGSNYANQVVGAIPLTNCAECAGVVLAVGALQVNLTPTNVVNQGAEWSIDGEPGGFSGSIVSNLPIGEHTISFSHVDGWTSPGNETVLITSNALTVATVAYTAGTPGTLNVNLLPPAAASAGALWQVNGGPLYSSGTTTNLTAGMYTVSFASISGWATPPNQIVFLNSGVPLYISGIYTQGSNSSLVLLTNGPGKITHAAWPASLVLGKTYKVTAVPNSKNVFTGWIGGTNQPFTLLSSAVNYSFVDEPNLVLEANFATNVYQAAAGAYAGLFGPEDQRARTQANSGSFSVNITSAGAFSGSLNIAGQKMAVSGKLDSGGAAVVNTKSTQTLPSMNVALQMDFTDQSISGTVTNGAFASILAGNRNVFSAAHKATLYERQYTIAIPGVSDPAMGPFGNSYGTVKVSATGAIAFSGSLADGTAVSQSSIVSQSGYWPLYISLYGGKGSLWGWNVLDSNGVAAVAGLSWINQTNSVKTAVYRSGFTNQSAALAGSAYNSAILFPAGLITTLEQTNPPFTIALTNLAGNTNKLTLKTNKTTGVITGTFVNPNNSKQTLKVNGVVLQNLTNAAGYFLTTNQSGSFSVGAP